MIDWTRIITKEEKEHAAKEQNRHIEKHEKQRLIDELVVDVDGFIFDGNERSQARMALVSSAIGDSECVSWVLNNNEVANVTGRQLREAVRLSALKMSYIWTTG